MGKFSPRNLMKHPGRLSYHDMILEEAGLVSYWNFGAGAGNKAWDQKSTNHGTISGATWTQKSNGIYMLDFDGNDYVNVSDSPSLDISSGDFSVSFWIYPETSEDFLGIYSKSNSAYAGTPRISNNNGNLNVLVAYTSSTYEVEDLVALTLNSWQYIVVRKTGNTVEAYKDGVKSATTLTLSSGLWDGGDNVVIGRLAASQSTLYFNGLINEVAIYNVALSPATILKHCQVGVWEGLAA